MTPASIQIETREAQDKRRWVRRYVIWDGREWRDFHANPFTLIRWQESPAPQKTQPPAPM